MTKEDFIKVFPAFKNSPPDLLTDMLAAGRQQAIVRNSRVYAEGDACQAIAFVLSGEIRVYKIGENGREITLYEIGPGETCILNASCILSRTTYPANAITASDAIVLLIPSPDFRRLMAEQKEMRDFVFSLLSQRLTTVMALVEEVAFGRMDQRLLEYLIERSENNRLESTHQKIANDLGTSREVVSRLLKDLERKQQVRLSRNAIQILKLEA
jgi:CRP/FNR family transcriptional regulator, anaerobic regulatory protein